MALSTVVVAALVREKQNVTHDRCPPQDMSQIGTSDITFLPISVSPILSEHRFRHQPTQINGVYLTANNDNNSLKLQTYFLGGSQASHYRVLFIGGNVDKDSYQYYVIVRKISVGRFIFEQLIS